MKTFWQAIQAGTATAAGILGAAGLRRLVLRRSLPPKRETLRIAGLHAEVEVLFDRWGVPHIYAEHPADLFFAQGYCHARDRFWQMELNRRTARGELCELFGARLLGTDRFLRRLGFRRAAEHEMATVDEPTRAIAAAYAGGVNAYIERHPAAIEFKILRLRPQPWQPVDSLALARFMGWSLTVNWETELIRARLIAQVGPERLAALEPGQPAPTVPDDGLQQLSDALSAAQAFQPLADLMGGGSNNWVVAADRSSTGRPVLANDPHLRPRMPGAWYVAHLNGGGFNVAGITLPGTLGVLVGHNERVAWGVTAAMTDCQDLFLERADPLRPGRFAFGDAWYDAEVVHEEIRIRGRANPFIDEVVITRHGPLLNGTLDIPAQGTPLAQRSTLDDAPSQTEALLGMNRAADWPSFRAALSLWAFPALNFVYADVAGTIAYKLAGRIPLRARGAGYVPAPGWSADHEWVGYVPFDEMPEAVNPPEGIFATANTKPAAPCRHFLARDWADDGRWQRIMELLRKQPQHTLDDSQAIQTDVVSLPARAAARLLVARLADETVSAAESARHPLRSRALAYLADWDGNLAPESVAGAIYHVLRRELVRHVGRDLPPALRNYLLGQGTDAVVAAVSAFHHRASSYLLGYLNALNDAEEAAAVLDAALAELCRQLGNDPAYWQWGRLHTISFPHPIGLASPALDRLLGLSRGPFPIGGDADTVAQTGLDPWHLYTASTYTVSYRQLVDVGDWDRTRFILPSGQSGHPGSMHYSDMLGLWRRGEYCLLPFTRAAVEQDVTEGIFLQSDTRG